MLQRALSALFIVGMLTAAPAAAQKIEVDLALVLAIDSSTSVNDERWKLQMEGYAKAFRSPHVLDAILSGYHKRIAVTMVHWSSAMYQKQIGGWFVLDDRKSAEHFASFIGESPRILKGTTALQMALTYSASLLQDMPVRAMRRVIDISGDGMDDNAHSPNPSEARDTVVGQGITINGLPIQGIQRSVVEYYRTAVIGGPGSFLVVANGYEHFGKAILKKLVREIVER